MSKIHDELRKFFQKAGKKGAAARNESLTKSQRSAIAKKAAKARWTKTPRKKPQ